MQEVLYHRRQFHSYVVTPTNAVAVSYYVSVNGTDLARERAPVVSGVPVFVVRTVR